MYNAVGIDISKNKSTIAILQPGGTIIRKPFNVSHTSQNLIELADYLGSLEGSTKIVMECTVRCHEPMLKALYEARLFVSVMNPHLSKNFGNNSLQKVKSDPADASKIARYTLDNWAELRQYSGMDNIRTQLVCCLIYFISGFRKNSFNLFIKLMFHLIPPKIAYNSFTTISNTEIFFLYKYICQT